MLKQFLNGKGSRKLQFHSHIFYKVPRSITLSVNLRSPGDSQAKINKWKTIESFYWSVCGTLYLLNQITAPTANQPRRNNRSPSSTTSYPILQTPTPQPPQPLFTQIYSVPTSRYPYFGIPSALDTEFINSCGITMIRLSSAFKWRTIWAQPNKKEK